MINVSQIDPIEASERFLLFPDSLVTVNKNEEITDVGPTNIHNAAGGQLQYADTAPRMLQPQQVINKNEIIISTIVLRTIIIFWFGHELLAYLHANI